ncbi:chymotrypsinogen A-like [Daphnia pulicaria]|uniref:chymotrypsinogen A-like n=1 Tax=Daphnia pulicaria TaxID=35523 RepID=UPI001EEAC4F7|nr:chymotrypsinogen A-like [Daphnia pulicaria]
MIVLLAVVTLLSFCSPASSFALFLPRVSRTDDAIVIDLDGVRQTLSYQDRTFYGPITNPGFVPFNPYPSVRQQEQTPNGWAYAFEHPSPPAPDRQKPSPVCGAGPAIAARESTSERISARSDAKKGSWPFIVALRKIGGSLFCSGSLVSDTRILLAAQCFEKMSLHEMSGVTVLVGMHKADQSDVQMTRRISKVILHNRYNTFTYANDIAMIVMDAPVIFSRSVAPVCLPPASTDPDQHLELRIIIIIKWKNWIIIIVIGSKEDKSTVLQQARVTLMPNSECKVDPTIGKYVTDNSLCITSDDNDKFTCPEDVGGPVVALPSPGAWTLIGINSYTKNCETTGLKTRVSAYRDWIDQYMK